MKDIIETAAMFFSFAASVALVGGAGLFVYSFAA
jgi:hypothetical protein